jgi:hypothetical protein
VARMNKIKSQKINIEEIAGIRAKERYLEAKND